METKRRFFTSSTILGLVILGAVLLDKLRGGASPSN